MKKSGTRARTGLTAISKILQTSHKRTQTVFTISKLRKDWATIVGEMISTQTRPKKLDRNILWVSVENSGLHYELSLMKPALLEKIQEISKLACKDIKFVHEPIGAPQVTEGPSRRKFDPVKSDPNEDLSSMLERIKKLSIDLQKKARKDLP